MALRELRMLNRMDVNKKGFNPSRSLELLNLPLDNNPKLPAPKK